jgi:CDGSH-type Zn-finger protein
MTEPVIEVITGGPLRVGGVPLVRLVRRDDGWGLGAPLATGAYLLCRCGSSASMPFCDAAPPYACFEEEPATGVVPEPFRWEVPDPGDPAVALKPGGPVRVAGSTSVRDASGNVMDPGRRVSLCRCGASRCQPLCDGSHKIVVVPDP